MGVIGLTTYINENSDVYLADFKLHDCKLLVDGNAIASQLYTCHTKSNHAFGGDYGAFEHAIKTLLNVFEKCNISALFLFDGGYEHRKLKTVIKRLRLSVAICGQFTRSYKESKCYPLLMKDVFKCTLKEMNIPIMQSDYEADQELVILARMLGCAVLSSDSDFYLSDVPYIPFTSLEMAATKSETEPTTHFTRCKIFYLDSLIGPLGGLKDKTYLPLVSALLGNDYLANGIFPNFLALRNCKTIPRRIKKILDWLRDVENLDQATDTMLKFVHKPMRKSVRLVLRRIIDDNARTFSILAHYLPHDFMQNISENILRNHFDQSNGPLANSECEDSHVEYIESAFECKNSLIECEESSIECMESVIECKKSLIKCEESSIKCIESEIECKKSLIECEESSIECREALIEYQESPIECEEFATEYCAESEELDEYKMKNQESVRNDISSSSEYSEVDDYDIIIEKVEINDQAFVPNSTNDSSNFINPSIHLTNNSANEIDSSIYLTNYSSNEIDSSIQLANNSSNVIDSSIHLTINSSNEIDSSINLTNNLLNIDSINNSTNNSWNEIDSSINLINNYSSNMNSSNISTNNLSNEIDSSILFTNSSSNMMDKSNNLTNDSSQMKDSSINLTYNSSNEIDSSINLTNNSGHSADLNIYPTKTSSRNLLLNDDSFFSFKDEIAAEDHPIENLFPSIIVDQLRRGLIPSYIVNIANLGRIFLHSQVENYADSPAHEIAIPIINSIVDIVSGKASICHARVKNGSVGAYTVGGVDTVGSMFPYECMYGSVESRRKLFLQNMKFLIPFDANVLDSVPENMKLYVITLVYWMRRAPAINSTHLRGVVLCLIYLSIVDEKIGYIRSRKELETCKIDAKNVGKITGASGNKMKNSGAVADFNGNKMKNLGAVAELSRKKIKNSNKIYNSDQNKSKNVGRIVLSRKNEIKSLNEIAELCGKNINDENKNCDSRKNKIKVTNVIANLKGRIIKNINCVADSRDSNILKNINIIKESDGAKYENADSANNKTNTANLSTDPHENYHATNVPPENCYLFSTNSITKEECVIFANNFLDYHKRDETVFENRKSFNIKLVHVFAQLQCCYQHAIILNSVLGHPWVTLSPSKCFSGTFIYNAYTKLHTRTTPDELVTKNLLLNAPEFRRIYKEWMKFLHEFIPQSKADRCLKRKRMRAKRNKICAKVESWNNAGNMDVQSSSFEDSDNIYSLLSKMAIDK